jgi:AcrR family transcriptional regulator
MTDPMSHPRGEYAKTPARRQEIIDAAVEVFAAGGFHKGSLRDVAERAGLSQAGLLHHFPSKNHLIEAVLTWRDDRSRTRFAGRESGLENLRALVDLVEYNQTKTPELVELYAILSGEATAPDHPVHDYFRRRYAWVLAYVGGSFEAMAEAGQLRPGVDSTSASRAVVALMDGLQIQWLYDRDAVDMAAEVRGYVQSLMTVEL